MVTPPSANLSVTATDDLVLLRRVTAFGQELAGTLRRASVIDLLLRHIRESLAPTEMALALFHRDAEAQDFLQAWPPGPPRPPGAASAGRAPRDRCCCPTASTRWSSKATAAAAGRRGLLAGLPVRRPGPRDGRGRRVRNPVASTTARCDCWKGWSPRPASPSKAPGWSTCTTTAADRGRRWSMPSRPPSASSTAAGRIRRANRAFADLVNAPPASLIGRPWQAFVPPEWALDLQTGPGSARSGPRGRAPHRGADLCRDGGADYQHRPIRPRPAVR